MTVHSQEREADPASLTGRSTVRAVIDAFTATVDPYGEGRVLRASLSYVEAGLGSMPVRAVRPRHVDSLIDHLRDAGLGDRCEGPVMDALHSLYAFAVARGLVDADPLAKPDRKAPSPTLTMIAFGAKVALWTTWIVTVALIGLAVLLLLELA